MHRIFEEIASRLPRDCAERVESAKTQYNQLIRSRLSDQLKLNLKGKRSFERLEADIYIQVVEGYPVSLRNVTEIPEDDWATELLAAWEGDLNRLESSTANILQLLKRINQRDQSFPDVNPENIKSLEDVLALAKSLEAKAEQACFAKRIFAIQDDILGVYIPRSDGHGEVELYWTAIGVAAEMLQVGIQDLATVVLIHELAHGYTHLGKDTDDLHWNTNRMFRKADRGVVEGLAQYYTEIIAEELGDKSQGVHEAYLRLRRKQRGWYRIHDQWVQAYMPETVRAALLKFRRDDQTSLERFQDLLVKEKEELRSENREIHWRLREDIERNGPISTKEEKMLDSVIIQTELGKLTFQPAEQAIQALAQMLDVQADLPIASVVSEWRMSLTQEFGKSMAKMDRKVKGQIMEAIYEICRDPLTPKGDTIKPLSKNLTGIWRYRIGDNRLLYYPDRVAKQITVMDFGPRGEVYED